MGHTYTLLLLLPCQWIIYYLYMIQGHSCTRIVELAPRIDREVHVYRL